jgi:OOP family OmpA-OmpF porin
MNTVTRTVIRLLPVAIAALALGLFGCGPVSFQGKSGLRIVGDLPPPPPKPKPQAVVAPRRVEIKDNRIVINEKIQFKYDSAEILEVSHSLLAEVATVMKENPHVKKVRVEGHASDEGRGEAANQYNKNLSRNRAKAVMAHLIKEGVEATRLEHDGYGVEKPLTSNDTEEGREKNRRVEFNILEQDVTKKGK